MAVQAAASCHPHVVLLDLGLPGMSGFEVARRRQQSPRFEETVLVALSDYGTHEDRHRTEAAGFDEHLVKPASMDVLRRLDAHPKLNGN